MGLELESLRDRYKGVSDELASTNEDRVKLTEKVDDLRQQLNKLNQDRDSKQRTSMKQVEYFTSTLYLLIITSRCKREVKVMPTNYALWCVMLFT